MNRYKVKTGVLVCYLMALLFAAAGCEGIDSLNRAGPGQPYSWLTDEEKRAALRDSDSDYDVEMGLLKLRMAERDLERLEAQQRLETARINENTRQMLRRSKIQRELRK